jgi:hypothetical protein
MRVLQKDKNNNKKKRAGISLRSSTNSRAHPAARTTTLVAGHRARSSGIAPVAASEATGRAELFIDHSSAERPRAFVIQYGLQGGLLHIAENVIAHPDVSVRINPRGQPRQYARAIKAVVGRRVVGGDVADFYGGKEVDFYRSRIAGGPDDKSLQ